MDRNEKETVPVQVDGLFFVCLSLKYHPLGSQ